MATDEQSAADSSHSVTRREFLGGAGATTGALLALGSLAGLTGGATRAQAAIANRSYYSPLLTLEIDGAFAGTLLAAAGGEPVLELGQPTALSAIRPTIRYESLQVTLGTMTKTFYDWVDQSLKGAAGGRTIAVQCLTADMNEWYHLTMSGARLTELALDGVDAGTTAFAKVTATIVPQASAHELAATPKSMPFGQKSKRLSQNLFRFFIQGYESTTGHVFSIGRTGVQLRPDGLWGALPLKVDIRTEYAGPLYQWMTQAVQGKAKDLPGVLQLLSTDLSTVLASFEYPALGITRMSGPAQALGDTVSRVAVEFYCRGMNFNFDGLSA